MKTYIKNNEGTVLKVYDDATGKEIDWDSIRMAGLIEGIATIGTGRNLEDNGISKYEAAIMLDSDINNTIADLRRVFDYKEFELLSFNRKMALTDMMFNLGSTRFRTFKKMIKAVIDKDFSEAADEIMLSKYAQKNHNRAVKNAELMRKG